jgi:hypothetical protein
MDRSQNIEEWASAYIAFQQDGRSSNENHPLWWAAERFMQDPGAEDCWSAILAVLAKNPPDSVIGMLAAGPLEDLIHQAGPQYIDRIELELVATRHSVSCSVGSGRAAHQMSGLA